MSPFRNAIKGHNTYLFEALEPFVTVLELVEHAGDFGHLSSYEIDLHVFCELISEPLQPFLVFCVEVDFEDPPLNRLIHTDHGRSFHLNGYFELLGLLLLLLELLLFLLRTGRLVTIGIPCLGSTPLHV